VYGEWQPAYDKIKEIGVKLHVQVQFVRNPDSEQLAQLYNTFKPGLRTLLIIDDQMAYGRIRKDGGGGLTSDQTLCTRFASPRFAINLYIVQNLLNQPREMRNVSLNSHYLVLFKNTRDKTQIRTLGQQMYPRDPHFLVAAFEDATRKPYGYLVLDLHPAVDDQYRVRSNLFDHHTIIYQSTSI
jgi:hypothetical protein